MAWSWQYYETYTVIQKYLLLSLLGVMIVEKIIVVSIYLCYKKTEPTGRNKVGTGQVTLGTNTPSNYQKCENLTNKIHPETFIDTERVVFKRPTAILGKAMLDIRELGNLNGYNDVGTLKEQIESVRKKSKATNLDPVQRMAFKNYPNFGRFSVNFSPIKK
jgi:hypothetical protein